MAHPTIDSADRFSVAPRMTAGSMSRPVPRRALPAGAAFCAIALASVALWGALILRLVL